MNTKQFKRIDAKLNAIVARANVTDQRVKEDGKTGTIYTRVDAMIVRRRRLA